MWVHNLYSPIWDQFPVYEILGSKKMQILNKWDNISLRPWDFPGLSIVTGLGGK